ncbi:methionine aminopeptidase, partial [Chlamydia psittaci 03DC29]
SISL